MKEKDEFNKLSGEIITSYENRVKTVTSLITHVVQKLKAFHREQIKSTDRLRDMLAKTQNLRKKDFDRMIAEIRLQQQKREDEITQMAQQFCSEEAMMVSTLRGILSGKVSYTTDEFSVLKKKILEGPKASEQRLARILKNFHQQQKELAAAVHKLLEKGDRVRIKDFKAMIKAFEFEHQTEFSGMDEILEEFDTVKAEISNQWKHVMASMNRKGFLAPMA